jgi:signal transduction histidine kinase
MSTILLDDIHAYVGFGPLDADRLRELRELAAPEFPAIAARFYDSVLSHPQAHAAITGGAEQVARLQQTLVEWMDSGLSGPHDAEYLRRRLRIGRVHVAIGLPQRYMFTAMNRIRVDLHRIVDERLERTHAARETHDALDKLLDTELALMLHSYQQDSEERLLRRERLAAMGQFAGSIGHDLRNPLGVIASSAFLLRKHTGDEHARRHLDRIDGQVATANAIVTSLLEMVHDRPLRREPIDFPALFAEVGDALRPRVPAHVELVLDPGAEPVVYAGDPSLLRQVLLNLLDNALESGPRGRVEARVERDGAFVILSVQDDGPGFPPEVLARAFQPLVTTRPSGTGLGLALVQRVAERHGGEVVATNLPSGGARVELRLGPAGS